MPQVWQKYRQNLKHPLVRHLLERTFRRLPLERDAPFDYRSELRLISLLKLLFSSNTRASFLSSNCLKNSSQEISSRLSFLELGAPGNSIRMIPPPPSPWVDLTTAGLPPCFSAHLRIFS